MGTKYKRVPRRVLALADFHLTDGQWESLMVPISMAFFFRSTPDARVVAFYPSPAGATESQLAARHLEGYRRCQSSPDRTWKPMSKLFSSTAWDMFAGFAAPEYYVLPIDECYKLVGLIRANWRGLSGGTEVWQEIGQLLRWIETNEPPWSREEAHA